MTTNEYGTLHTCTECGAEREVDQWTGMCYECVLDLSDEMDSSNDLCEGCDDCEPYIE